MDTVFLKPVWLYLPDGSKERIIAQTGDDQGIGFDSIHGGAERKHYFRYDEYSVTQTKRGDYVVSPVDDGCEKIYYPNGVYEYVSKVVQHDGFWEAHVRNCANERRVACWSRIRFSLEHKRDGWYWQQTGPYEAYSDYEVKFAGGSRQGGSRPAHRFRVRHFTRSPQ